MSVHENRTLPLEEGSLKEEQTQDLHLSLEGPELNIDDLAN
jgi:hypothetical protein